MHDLSQLTSEDETFLTENATATLSQFEKVTANLGENKRVVSLKCLNIQVIGQNIHIYLVFFLPFQAPKTKLWL